MVFNFLLKFFRKKKSITFTLYNDITNNLTLSMSYSEYAPEDIAAIIYSMNRGLFLGKMIQILTDGNRSQDSDTILAKLDQLYLLEKQNDVLIKPLETFEKNAK